MENKIILHRGYKGKYLENSLSSFENAIRGNMPFEIDIRISKDGKCFMIHDDNLDRLFNGTGKINEHYSRELEKFEYKKDSSQKLCSLNELCGLIKRKNYNNLIFTHIKKLKDIDNVIETLVDYDLSEIIKFFAVDELTLGLIKIIKRNYPEYKAGLHFNDNSKINEEEFKIADFIWADETTKENITSKLVNTAHRFGKSMYAVSPELIPESIFNKNIGGRWIELMEMNVDGICTDKPYELSEFLKNY